jgi:hypothetical protein
MWTRRRTLIDGEGRPDDWIIVRRGQEIGRVYKRDLPRGEGVVWEWMTWTYPNDHGSADTMEQALEKLRAFIRSHWSDEVDWLRMS